MIGLEEMEGQIFLLKDLKHDQHGGGAINYDDNDDVDDCDDDDDDFDDDNGDDDVFSSS